MIESVEVLVSHRGHRHRGKTSNMVSDKNMHDIPKEFKNLHLFGSQAWQCDENLYASTEKDGERQ